MNPEGPALRDTRNYRVRTVTFEVVRETSRAGAFLGGPEAAAEVARQLIPDDAREHFGVLLLNSQNKLVAYHEVSVGTLSESLVHPREVFGPALRIMGVRGLILVHNHPSGDPTPSQEDTHLTRQLAEAGKLLGVPVCDHIVIGNGSGQWVSFMARGLL